MNSDFIYLLFSSHVRVLSKSGARVRETTGQLVEIETSEQHPTSCGGAWASVEAAAHGPAVSTSKHYMGNVLVL